MTDKNRPHDWPDLSALMSEARKHGVGLLGPQAKVTPYIGLAGFTTPEEVRSVAADARTLSGFGTPLHGGRRLAIGVLVDWESLNGDPSKRFPERYPPVERIRGIFEAAATPYAHRAPWQPPTEGTDFDLASRCLRLIHYASKEPNLLAQLDRLCEIAGPHLDGIQLDMIWPPEEDVRSWAEDHPTKRLILQVNRGMFSNLARKPALLVKEIGAKYAPWITDILFDMSGGTGAPLDLTEVGSVLEALYSAFGGSAAGGTGIGVAGGIDWRTVVDLKPLFERWPDLSIDAEGRLRHPKTDALDCDLARELPSRAFGVMP